MPGKSTSFTPSSILFRPPQGTVIRSLFIQKTAVSTNS